MPNASALFGGKPSGTIQEIILADTQSWSPMYKMRAHVYVIGGGGSGGQYTSAGTAQFFNIGASGGGAGGCALSELILDPAVTYSVVIGDGGAAAGNTLNGSAGGNSEFSGTGITTMTANGGGGGEDNRVNGAINLSGGAGGTATGGNLANVTGGRGGNVSSSVTPTAYFLAASGGGAPGILGTGYRGGDITFTGDATVASTVFTGGGGVGGNGEDWSASANGGYSIETYGGTAIGAGISGLPKYWYDRADYGFAQTNTFTVIPSAGAFQNNANCADGVGTRGNNSTAHRADHFGGSGGSGTANSGNELDGSNVGLGGAGSGGVARTTSGNSSPGGHGVIIIKVLESL